MNINIFAPALPPPGFKEALKFPNSKINYEGFKTVFFNVLGIASFLPSFDLHVLINECMKNNFVHNCIEEEKT